MWALTGSRAYAGLTISATFDSTITSDPNAAAIENTINTAINTYETKFTDPINVTIKFQEMTSGLGSSNWWYYDIPYQQFINALSADKTTADDITALAHLPTGANNPVTGSMNINIKTANARALGIGLFPPSGNSDGVIGLNTHITDIGSPGTTGQYSLLSTTEHEIDEVLGLGSALSGLAGGNPLPEDLFRYTVGGSRSFVTSGDNAYFSIDGGATDLVRFNQGNNAGGDYGDWWSHNGGGNPGPVPRRKCRMHLPIPARIRRWASSCEPWMSSATIWFRNPGPWLCWVWEWFASG